jgi:hypothetical protein
LLPRGRGIVAIIMSIQSPLAAGDQQPLRRIGSATLGGRRSDPPFGRPLSGSSRSARGFDLDGQPPPALVDNEVPGAIAADADMDPQLGAEAVDLDDEDDDDGAGAEGSAPLSALEHSVQAEQSQIDIWAADVENLMQADDDADLAVLAEEARAAATAKAQPPDPRRLRFGASPFALEAGATVAAPNRNVRSDVVRAIARLICEMCARQSGPSDNGKDILFEEYFHICCHVRSVAHMRNPRGPSISHLHLRFHWGPLGFEEPACCNVSGNDWESWPNVRFMDLVITALAIRMASLVGPTWESSFDVGGELHHFVRISIP